MEQEERAAGELADPGGNDTCHQLIAALDLPVLLLDEALRCVHANQCFHETFHLDETDIAGRPLAQVDNGLFRTDELRILLERLLHGRGDSFGGIDFTFELHAQEPRTFSTSGTRLEGGPGGRLVLLAMRDVTDERLARGVQRNGEARYRALFETSRDAVMMLAPPNWRFVSGNPAALRLFRCRDEAEFTTLGPWDLSPATQPDGQRSTDLVASRILQAMENRSVFFEWTHRRLDGEEFPATVLLSRIDQEGGMLLQAIVREIPPIGREDPLRILLSDVTTASYRCEATGEQRMLHVGGGMESITGLGVSELLGRPARSLSSTIHPDDRSAALDTVWKNLDERSPFTVGYRMLHPDGSVRRIVETGRGVYGPDGDLRFIDGVLFDCTDLRPEETEEGGRRSALEELVRNRTADLRESEVKYRSVVEQVSDGIFIVADGSFLFANEAMGSVTGRTRQELYSLALADVVHPEDLDLFSERPGSPSAEAAEGGAFTARLLTPRGAVLHVEVSLRPIAYHGRTAVLGICRDVSEVLTRAEETSRMQRLGALGTLAGGIAHDFNNFLTVILGNISLARMMLDPGSGLQEILAESERAATNASSLTQQLLTFTTDGEPVRIELGVAELLEEALRGTLDGGRIVPDLRVGEDVPHVRVDPAQIVLALRNLIENAAQAMPSGGTITIRASRSADRANGRDADDPPGFVRIEIEDEGSGIPEEILPRVFDPFFTTRESAQGLGLTTAFSIVSRHGGRIRAENLPGGGCRFTLLLPTAEGAAEGPESGVGDVGRSGGRILVMDDKAMIRRSAEAMLDYLGYRVQTAADGAEAVRLYREAIEEEDRFDAVLLDLTVPGGMNGRETLAELRRIDPSVRAAISSGYPNDPAMVEHGRLGFRAAVIKPYSLLKLAAALREITAD